MCKWYFSINTIEKGKISFKVSAKDKQTAIKKGMEKARKTNLSLTPYWDVKLTSLI